MMGFGAMGMAPLLFGALAVVTIWGGLWWLLSAIGHPTGDPAPPPTRPLAPQGAIAWEQPSFEEPDQQGRRLAPTAPVPVPLPEHDYR